ncbi:hypothetical protein [Nocardia sp. NPDC052566]|uniref:hypothetical protein n=1 Tax=Nocardia sp. NPDC052566 TaxID=3364330 RepID=UPI0037CACBC1
MKRDADAVDEVHDVTEFRDAGECRLTPVVELDADAALAVVIALRGVVRDAHGADAARARDGDGVVRAQSFEEGDVYLLDKPFDGFSADRYLMDFGDVGDVDFCARMHLHTGPRFVRIMTGPDTRIRVCSLSPFDIGYVDGVTPFRLQLFTDIFPDGPDEIELPRYNAIVPENSWVDMQIPRGVSHQFNALGPYAVIDSIHPEESIEVFREKMAGLQMAAQTIYLAEELPAADTCAKLPAQV